MAFTFKQMTLEHHLRFMQEKGTEIENSDAGIISETYARLYHNFFIGWPEVQQALEIEFPYERERQLYRKLIHRKVAAVNCLLPVKLLMLNKTVLDWLSFLTGHNIRCAYMLEFDFPLNDMRYLTGTTRFDVIIEAKTWEKQKLRIGVNLQYAEEEAAYLPSERKWMFDDYDTSPYKELTNYIGYRENTLDTLRSESVKLLWKHHILGFSMLQKKEIDQFVLLHLFPNENLYLKRGATLFTQCVSDKHRRTFIPMTLEYFINSMRMFLPEFRQPVMDWVNYLENRFIPRVA